MASFKSTRYFYLRYSLFFYPYLYTDSVESLHKMSQILLYPVHPKSNMLKNNPLLALEK